MNKVDGQREQLVAGGGRPGPHIEHEAKPRHYNPLQVFRSLM